MKTTLVNFKHTRCDVKICRLSDNTVPPPPYKGFLGNPYHMPPFTRDEACRYFHEYFHSRLQNDEAFFKAVMVLKGKVLGCMCAPLQCHGDSVVAFLNSVEEDATWDSIRVQND